MTPGDRPEPHRTKVELKPELARFVENMGLYFESYGIPRIGGRILGLLLVASRPMSAGSIASTLRVSRASVSTNFRLLLASGMADKVTFVGERNTYYSFPETAWEKIMNAEIAGITAMRKLAEQGLNALTRQDPAFSRMRDVVDWAEFLAEMYRKGVEEWRKRVSEIPLSERPYAD